MSEELKIRINALTNKLINASISNIESNHKPSTIDSLFQACTESSASDSLENNIVDIIESSINDSFLEESLVDKTMADVSSQLKFNAESYQTIRNYIGSIINARSTAVSNTEDFDLHAQEAQRHGAILASNIEAGIIQSVKDYTGYGKGILRTKRKSPSSPQNNTFAHVFAYGGSSFEDFLQYSDGNMLDVKKNDEIEGGLKISTFEVREPVAISIDFSKTGPTESAISSLKQYQGVTEIFQLQVDFLVSKLGFNALDFSKYPLQTNIFSISFDFLTIQGVKLEGFDIRGKLAHSSIKKHFKNAKNGLVFFFESQKQVYSKTIKKIYDVKIQLLLKPQNEVNTYKFWLSSILISLTEAPPGKILNTQLIATKLESFNNQGVLIGSDLSENDYQEIIGELLDQHQILIENLFSDFFKRVGTRRTTQQPTSSSSSTDGTGASSSMSPAIPSLPLKNDATFSSSTDTPTSPRTARGDDLGNLSSISTSSKNRTPGIFIQKDSPYRAFVLTIVKENEMNADTSFKRKFPIDYFKIINIGMLSTRLRADETPVSLSEIEASNQYAIYAINFLNKDKQYKTDIRKKWKWHVLKKQNILVLFLKDLPGSALWSFDLENSYNFDVELGVDGKSYYIRASVFIPDRHGEADVVFQLPVIGNKTISFVLNRGQVYSIVIQNLKDETEVGKQLVFLSTKNNVVSNLPHTMIVYDAKNPSIRGIAEIFAKKIEKLPSFSEETDLPVEEIKILHSSSKLVSINFKNEAGELAPRWKWHFFKSVKTLQNVLLIQPSEKNLNNLIFFDFQYEGSYSTLNTWKIDIGYPDGSKIIDVGSFKIKFNTQHIAVASILNNKIHFFVYLKQNQRSQFAYSIEAILFVFNKQFKHLPYSKEHPLIYGEETSKFILRESGFVPPRTKSNFAPEYFNNIRGLPSDQPTKKIDTDKPQTSVILFADDSEDSSSGESFFEESVDALKETSKNQNQEGTILSPPEIIPQEMILSPPEIIPQDNTNVLSVSPLSSFSSSSSDKKSQMTTDVLESQIIGTDFDSNINNDNNNEDEEEEMLDLSEFDAEDISSFLY